MIVSKKKMDSIESKLDAIASRMAELEAACYPKPTVCLGEPKAPVTVQSRIEIPVRDLPYRDISKYENYVIYKLMDELRDKLKEYAEITYEYDFPTDSYVCQARIKVVN